MEIFHNVLDKINIVVIAVFMVALGLQIIYMLLFFLPAKKYKKVAPQKRIAVVCSARNESSVIVQLIRSVMAQNYPRELFDFIMVADNCTDNTAELARAEGATVYERFESDTKKHRLGYALQFLFENILRDHDNYDAFVKFDADNLVDPDYLARVNDALCAGMKLGKGYNNAKNLTGESGNVISCISGLWYIRDNRFNCHARSALRLGQLMTGPGMMISAEIIRANGGWVNLGISEDADFTLSELLKGNKAEYVPDAIFYDDQPTSIKDTFRRNMRMGRGLMHTFGKYGTRCLGKFFTTFKFTYLDMFITELFIPMAAVACLWFPFYYIYFTIYWIATANFLALMPFLDMLWKILVFAFVVPFIAQALLVYFLDRKKIKATFWQVLPGILAFPLFMIFYAVGITLGVFFKPQWKAISRSKSVTIEELTGQSNVKPEPILIPEYAATDDEQEIPFGDPEYPDEPEDAEDTIEQPVEVQECEPIPEEDEIDEEISEEDSDT